MLQLVLCINYCHNKNIVHLDIKPENFIVCQIKPLKIKLIDFGFSEFYEKYNDLFIFTGTIPYVAPEILKCNYHFNSDIWSLGCVIYCLMYKIFPFNCDNYIATMHNVEKSTEYLSLLNLLKSEYHKLGHLSDLLLRMFIIDPIKRISSSEVLLHHFLKN